MKQISSADLYFLTKDLKILENQRIDSFYYEDSIFYIKVYVKKQGHLFLTNKVSKYIYIGNEKQSSTYPSSFVQYLRKYVKNGFIREINQIPNERILDIVIEKKQLDDTMKEFHIVIELFANGNVIITDNNYSIKNSLQKKKFKDRKVMVNEKYELPPQKEISIFNLNEKLFIQKLKETDLSIVKFLAIKFGVGGKFAEEMCTLSNIDKNKNANIIDKTEIQAIIKSIDLVRNKEIKAYGIYNEKDELVDFVPFEFISIQKKIKSFESYNKLIKVYFSQFVEEIDKREENLKKELNKLKNRLDKQEKQKKNILEKYEKYNSMGNKIYNNYALIEELLTSINKSSKEKSWEYVLEVIKSNPELSKIVKKLNYKNNEIILQLE